MKRIPVSGTGRRHCRQVAENPASVMHRTVGDQDIEALWKLHGRDFRRRLFTPLVTLWTFIAQVLADKKTLRKAVSNTMTSMSEVRGHGGSYDPSAYCQARYRMPVEVLKDLTHRVASQLEKLVPARRLWHGHRVVLADGSSVSMPDTRESQLAFPQPSAQKRGCGFPVARIVALFSLTTGAVIDLVVGKLADAELTLWRRLWDKLAVGDVVLADRLFGQYVDIAQLLERGIHMVARIDKMRKTDFRQGKRLGRNDHIVTWHKPLARSTRLSDAEWQSLPESITLREVRFTLNVRGFKARSMVLVTTLLDSEEYSVKELAKLYRRRWEVETDFSHLKTSMQMGELRGKKPAMIIRELWAYMLAYNLIRTLMWEAGTRRRLDPLDISLSGAIDKVTALWPFAAITPAPAMQPYYNVLLHNIGSDTVPDRPHRHEPRCLKRRHKDFDYLTKPRKAFKAEAVVMA